MPPFLLAASFTLSFVSSVALLAALVLVAAGFSVWTYRVTVPEIAPGRKAALVVLRATALALLLFLLFEPVLNLRRTENVAPHVAVLLDDSRSMTVRDADTVRGEALRAFVRSRALADAGAHATLVPYRFAAHAARLGELSPDSLAFRGGETDIADALLSAADEQRENNLCAIVLATDGEVTAGPFPLHVAESLGVPVFAVGVGDSTEKRDLLVTHVLANSLAYVGSVLPVDATVRSAGFDEGTVEATLSESGTVVDRQTVRLGPGTNEYPVHFTYTPATDGMKKLVVEVAPRPGELTTKNNRATVFVKVLKSKMNVVLLAGAPSPDVSLFDQVLTRDRNVALKMFVQKFGAAWYGAAPTPGDFAAADCIVLIGYPMPTSGMATLRMVRAALDQRNTPLFLVFSREIDLGTLRTALDPYLPFDVVQQRNDETQVFFDLRADARENPVVSSGIPADAWNKLPPIFRTETSVKPRIGAQTLGTMRLNNIPFREPLLLERTLNRNKVLVSTGYGLWRWQLADDVLGGKLPDALVSNGVRWLTTRDDDKRVRIAPVKEFFDSGERVEFTGQVYNESLEPVDDAAVTVVVHSAASGDRDIALAPMGAGRYAGSVDGLGEGDYTYAGQAARDGAVLGKDNGRFSVGELNVEFQQTRMDNTLLRQIAARSGGAYFPVDRPGGLADALRALKGFGPRPRTVSSDVRLWNLGWLLGAAVLLFAAEWFLRKRAGML